MTAGALQSGVTCAHPQQMIVPLNSCEGKRTCPTSNSLHRIRHVKQIIYLITIGHLAIDIVHVLELTVNVKTSANGLSLQEFVSK